MNSSTVSWALAREATSFKTQATRSQDGSTLCTVQVRLTYLRFKYSCKVNLSSRSSKHVLHEYGQGHRLASLLFAAAGRLGAALSTDVCVRLPDTVLCSVERRFFIICL